MIINPMTIREEQVLALVAQGCTTKEIAALLGRSIKTVDNQRTRIMAKLKTRNAVSTARFFIVRENGIRGAIAGGLGGKCRECGCTEGDCSGCVRKTGRPCHWVENDLCSACIPKKKATA